MACSPLHAGPQAIDITIEAPFYYYILLITLKHIFIMDIEFVRSRFIKHFDGKTGNIYTSPGRINLIGEHTD